MSGRAHGLLGRRWVETRKSSAADANGDVGGCGIEKEEARGQSEQRRDNGAIDGQELGPVAEIDKEGGQQHEGRPTPP